MEASGPGHVGSRNLDIRTFSQTQQFPSAGPLYPGKQDLHKFEPHLPPTQPLQQLIGMRVSPAPPTTGANQPPHPMPSHSPHISAPVGGGGGVVMPPHQSNLPSDSRAGGLHAPNYSTTGPSHMTTPPSPSHGYPPKMAHIPTNSTSQYPPYQQPPATHQYPPRAPLMQSFPQNFPPGAQQPPSGMPPSHQYPRPPPHSNHVPPNQPYGYPHFGQQNWVSNLNQGQTGPNMPGTPMMATNAPSNKGAPNPVSSQTVNCIGVPRPHAPQYMKQHLQHKVGGYVPGPPPNSPQMYPNGPSMTIPNSRESPQNIMPPPSSTPQPLTPSSIAADSEHSINMSLMNSNPPSIGPDGNPIVDEASQQSTVSNSSVASGDDSSSTPKLIKECNPGMQNLGMPPGTMGQQSLPSTPINSAASPGAASMNSQQDEMENINSPGWPRSPSTQAVFANNQPPPPPDLYRPSKPGDIARLYEMSDSPERRAWLDKLLTFMDEKGTAITACPTISKNPLDLYALYLHVRERGGFVEVTKNKQWKDVAAVMGIGASSSGSFTLRRHYMKNLLAYECKFDRGGIDPQPIINQIEASSKKKSSKTMSVPSPGSSNSQDSFPPPGSNSSSLDGFANGPHVGSAPGMSVPYSQYPPSSDFQGHPQRPSNQSNSGYQGYQGAQYQGYQGMHSYSQGGFSNSGYQPDRGYQQPPGQPAQANFQNYSQTNNFQRSCYPPNQQGYPQEFSGYQNSGMYPPQKPGTTSSPSPAVPQGPPNSNAAAYQGPRRHPDFEKGQQAWRGNSQFNSFNGTPVQTSASQPWSRPGDTAPVPTSPPQWNQTRFPVSQSATTFVNQQARWSGGTFTQAAAPRPPMPPKNFVMGQATAVKTGFYPAYMGKPFPHDSVEAVFPVLVRRKRMSPSDLPGIDPWRLLMSLRSGLAAEVTWALDVLSILLYDDQSVIYFGLQHMPGLLETLIEHLRRGLINMFDICSDLELGRDDEAIGANKRVKAEQHDYGNRTWYEKPPPSPVLELDLGKLDECDPNDKTVVLNDCENCTLLTKTGKSVKFIKREGEIFMKEGNREWDKWEGFDSGIDTWSVGGGECTVHIICSMQSNVHPIPFTRLIREKTKNEIFVPHCEVKIEKLNTDNEASDKKDICFPVSFEETDKSKQIGEVKDSDMRVIMPSCKSNRLNHAKASKLDAIVKRIKKEPKIIEQIKETKEPVIEPEVLKIEPDEKTDMPKSELVVPVKPKRESIERLERRESGSSIRDVCPFKRPYDDLEEESWNPDEASLTITNEAQDWLARRVISIGTVIRNLSFIPGNEEIMSKSASLLAILGQTILLHHGHPRRTPSTVQYDKDEDADFGDWCSSLAPDIHWWWPYLHHIHESVLVTLANMSGSLDLSYYPEEISRPLLNGLLHWATCPSSYGQDPLTGAGCLTRSSLSPQRLALEALVKLCVLDQNTDLVLATPPFSRLDMLCSNLARMICRGEDQVVREFAVNLIHYFSAADSGVARAIAMQNGCVSLLVSFIEEAEAAAMSIANSQGVCVLKENPELMGTSLDMVRRAATALVHLSRVPDNIRVLATCEHRIFALVVSQILDTYVASQLSQVLFNMSQVQSEYYPQMNYQNSLSNEFSISHGVVKELKMEGIVNGHIISLPNGCEETVTNVPNGDLKSDDDNDSKDATNNDVGIKEEKNVVENHSISMTSPKSQLKSLHSEENENTTPS